MRGQAGLADAMFFLAMCTVASGLLVVSVMNYGVAQLKALNEAYTYFFMLNLFKTMEKANCTFDECMNKAYTIMYHVKTDLQDGVLDNRKGGVLISGKDVLYETFSWGFKRWVDLGYRWCILFYVERKPGEATPISGLCEGIVERHRAFEQINMIEKGLVSRVFTVEFPTLSYYEEFGEIEKVVMRTKVYLWPT